LDYDLAQIARTCLTGQDGVEAAKQISQHLASANAGYFAYAFDYPELLNTLARTQPFVFLDAFLGNGNIKRFQHGMTFRHDFDRGNNPLNHISENDLLSWCDNDPENRYPMIAADIQPFSESAEANGFAWKPILYRIFEKAPNLEAVLEHVADAIRPSGWSGSLADILVKRSVLFQNLYEHDDEKISLG
jgi:hypothetical protein